MKLWLLTPITSPVFDQKFSKRSKEIGLPQDVTVICDSLTSGTKSIESAFDEEYAGVAILETVLEKQKAGKVDYDAIIINCFADPTVDALRELVDIPVVGVGTAAITLAAQFAPRFSILAIKKNSLPRTYARLSRMGLTSRLASVYHIGSEVLDLTDETVAYEKLLQIGEKAVTEDCSDALILGCTGMANFAEKLQHELKVPVIDPTAAGLWSALTLCSLGLKHSRHWMYPKANLNKIIGRWVADNNI